MVGFSNFAEMTTADIFTSSYRKLPNGAPVVNVGYDFSMCPGNPSPNYYASTPLEAKVMSHTRNGGLYHGKGVSPKSKYLMDIQAVFSTASFARMQMHLLDYLLYYPFIDETVTDEQFMINDESLTRYQDGVGVNIMAISVAAATGGKQFIVNYTNSDGVSGRVTPPINMHTSSSFNGSTISSQSTFSNTGGCLFRPLQAGDKGVRSIQSVTMLGPDVGLFTLVLVKPLFTFFLGDFACVTHKNAIIDNGFAIPKIEDDAYLNYLAVSQGNFAGQSLIMIHNFLVK